jgi:hypothetical protein
MAEPLKPEVLATLRDVLSSDTPLARRLALLEPTKKLARMLAGVGASLIEAHFSSLGKPHGGFSAHCSREISGAQVTRKGDSRDATPSLP